MSLALYRKYRPGSFAEVFGQEHVTGPLQQALSSGRIHHAYLFSGPRGCGKTSSARILARSLNCEQGPTPTPCGVCDSCVALAPNGPGSLDVMEIDAASHGGVDDARELRERAFFAPVSSRFKVYIIDEAHMVTREGFNALLKLVEEPPAHLKFVFATTEPDKVIGTIRSRTHSYPFRLIPPRVLQGLLTTICEAEGAQIEPLVLPLVVRAGAGSARDALSVLDQLLAGAGPGGVTYADALGLLGYTDSALLDDVVDSFAAGDGAAVFEAVDRVVEGGHDPRRFTADLLERYRDLMVLHAVPEAGDKGLVDVPADQLERMRPQASRIGPAELSRSADILAAGLTEMRGATAPRLLLELLCARVLLPAAATDPASVLTRVERLERRLAIGTAAGAPTGTAAAPAALPARATPASASAATPAATPTGAATPAGAATSAPAPAAGVAPAQPSGGTPTSAPQSPAPPTPATAEAADAVAEVVVEAVADAAAVRRVWPQVLDEVKARPPRKTHALLMDAQVHAVENGTLTLSFKHAYHARSLDQGVNGDNLREALKAVLGVDWKLVATVAGATADALPSPVPAAGSRPPARPQPAAVPDFEPGDEPADEDPAAAAGSGEDAAMALLKSGLGARVIGQVEAG